MAFIGSLSGSLTQTTGGKSYIRAGSNITITSGSTEGDEHYVLIAGAAASSIAADDISAGDAAVSVATTSGNITVDSNAGSVTVDGHTGVTVQSTNSGDITLDSTADVILDADGDQISFKFGTATGQLDVSNTNSGDITIQQKTDSKIISFLDHDGSANLNILDAGAGISLIRDAAAIKFGANEDIILTHEADRGLILTQGTETTAEPVFTIKNTGNLAAGGGIEFVLDNGAGEGDDDILGYVNFKGDHSTDAATTFATISALSSDVTNNDEGGQIKFSVMAGGTAGTAAMKNLLSIGAEDVANSSPCEVVVNEDSIDCDFRVESNDSTHALHISGDGAVGFFASVDNADVDGGGCPGNSNFYVSGTRSAVASNTGPDNEDGAHFGGDLVVSGNTYTGGFAYFTQGVASSATVTATTNVVVGADIVHMSDTDTKIGFADDKMTFTAGGVEHLTIVEASDNEVVVNEGSAEVSFRAETNANTHALYVDAADEKVSLGVSSDSFASDTWLFVSGNTNMSDRHSAKGAVSVFGGGVVLSGSLLPGVDNSIDLGASTHRFANIYTADLNLRNDRGNWTLIEEEEFLSFRNNRNGKRYRMQMVEITGDGTYGPGNDGQL